jgi:serine/threonine protein kinase
MPEWIGKTIGKVRIEKLLARGGMAEVYSGTHVTLGRPVAVKLLHSYIEEEPLLLERFQREARVVAGLRHPNIVQIFDFDTIDGHPYIVMEYLKGPSLATYLLHLHERKKRSPLPQVARLLNGLTAALDYAHMRGAIHRDIKPGNILLHNKTDEFPLDKTLPHDVEAIVTDFGLVRLVDAATHTASGIISGTPAYMSPEQALGDETDHRTDIYSLGIVLYELLAGRVPFKADNTLTVLHMHIHGSPLPIPEVSARVQAVIDHALQKKPEDRYQTSREMANDFSRAIGIAVEEASISEPAPVRPAPSDPPVTLPPKIVTLPADLLALLSHENSSVRKLALQELVVLLDSQQLGLTRAAQEKLREIAASDDSLTLRRIAAQELSVRGIDFDSPVPVEIQKEKQIEKPPPPQENISPPVKKEILPPPVKKEDLPPPVKKSKDFDPLARIREAKFVLPKLEKRFVGGILGIVIGIIFLAGARQLIVNRITSDTPTPTISLTSPASSAPSMTITSLLTETSSPTLASTSTLTLTPTASPTLTSTPHPTSTPLPPPPTKRKRPTNPPQG